MFRLARAAGNQRMLDFIVKQCLSFYMSAIEKAVEMLDNQAAIARICGVSPQAVNQWVSGARPIPPLHAKAIERATNGAVTASELRPDLAEIFGVGAA